MIELKGKPVADHLYARITSEFSTWNSQKWSPPHLVVVLVGDDPASQVYVSHKEKACQKLGFKSTLIKLSSQISEVELSKQLLKLNADQSVDGVLLQLPLPKHLNARKMTELIAVEKDVDGLTQASLGALMVNHHKVASCTPAGIIEILKYYKMDLAGKKAIVVGRSAIVGLPLFHLLSHLNATVTLCHSKTENLSEIIKQAPYVFVAIGKPHFFKAMDFAKGATVVDVGIHRQAERIIGDVDFGADEATRAEAKNHLHAATPVPGGVGPMTIAMLMQNTYILAKVKREQAQ